MRYDCGVELHSLVTTEDTAFISFHYVYLYLTFVYNLSARHTEQYISLYLSQDKNSYLTLLIVIPLGENHGIQLNGEANVLQITEGFSEQSLLLRRTLGCFTNCDFANDFLRPSAGSSFTHQL